MQQSRFTYNVMAIFIFMLATTSLISAQETRTAAAPTPTPAPVVVKNTTTTPVPTVAQGTTKISGSVSVTGTPTVNAKQSGAWTVGISGTPNVQIANPETSPVAVREVDNPARNPFQTTLNNFGTSFQVPNNQRLVIEYISAQGEVPGGSLFPLLAIETTVQGSTMNHYVISTYQFTDGNGNNVYVVAQQTRIYADPGTTVYVNPNNPSFSFEMAISGYLENVP